MKFKGKIAIWVWAVFFGSNGLLIYELIFSPDSIAVLLATLFLFNLIFLPILVRNYVFIGEDEVMICFGFSKDAIKLSDIVKVYETHNPIASSAASLDRIVIKGKNNEIMCSVKEKARFLEELKKYTKE
ncbi:MAG: PH domain-containing protein [Lachnospiraceae bacterium]|nr:PH domain-containing protein [Lachnospiraceae bacterium]